MNEGKDTSQVDDENPLVEQWIYTVGDSWTPSNRLMSIYSDRIELDPGFGLISWQTSRRRLIGFLLLMLLIVVSRFNFVVALVLLVMFGVVNYLVFRPRRNSQILKQLIFSTPLTKIRYATLNKGTVVKFSYGKYEWLPAQGVRWKAEDEKADLVPVLQQTLGSRLVLDGSNRDTSHLIVLATVIAIAVFVCAFLGLWAARGFN